MSESRPALEDITSALLGDPLDLTRRHVSRGAHVTLRSVARTARTAPAAPFCQEPR